MLLVSLLVRSAEAQGTLTIHRDVISGRVTSDSGHGFAGAEVIISKAPDRAFVRSVTDATGHYNIVFEQGTGDYLVHVSAPGMVTVRKRVTRQGTDSVFSVDVVLKPTGAEHLATVRVTAQRPKPGRNCDYDCSNIPDAGAYTVNGAVAPGLAGNIDALAGTNPSLLVAADGLSAGGVSPLQNSTTLNGMSFPGTDLPRDARAGVAVRTSPYDPEEGWFGGMERSVGVSHDPVIGYGHAHLTLDAPLLQYTDPYSAALGQRFTNAQAGFGNTGFAHGDRLGYNYGISASRRTADGISLSSAPRAVLDRASVAPDSAAHLLSSLSALGVPLRSGLQRVTNRGSFLGTIGSRGTNIVSLKFPRTEWDALGYANVSHTSSIGSLATATGSSSAAASSEVASVQAHVSTYLHDFYLLDAKSAVSMSHSAVSPLLDSPSGLVSVLSKLDNGTVGTGALSFGGYNAGANDVRQVTWETSGNLRLYAPGSATHQMKVAADSRIDTWREKVAANANGTFAFNSIEAVVENRPFSFSRTLHAPPQSASAWNGFVSIGDWWHKSDAFQLLYGARLEGNRFLSAPASNPAVEAEFGQRTDFTPNAFRVSPRIGFAYTMRGSDGGYGSNAIGTFHSGPPRYLRGGIGEFRSLISPATIGAVSSGTGLIGATQGITCIGDAVPTPDWSEYLSDGSAIPSDCVGGAPARSYTDAAPSVELLDRSYTAPRSWRANLVYGTILHGAVVTLEGAYSLNLNQPGRADLNFADSAKFVTSNEQRPVYVESGAIVPASGALIGTSSRRDQAFGQVLDHLSSLTSTNRRLTVTVALDPSTLGGWFASAAYTLSDTRDRSSGFDNSTFGSPLERHWSRDDLDVRHRVIVQGGITGHGVTFTLFGRIQSGFPFTPLIGTDVNGDGFANDRAFMFDPARTSDTSMALGMRSLLGNAQKPVRDCLTRQLGRAAAQGSCVGPWTASLNAQLDFKFRFPRSHRETHFVMAFTDPLGGLDQVLHGVNHLHGWGMNGVPDRVLYQVRGFDPVSESYRYVVNPQFGNTRPTSGVARVPFGVTLDFSIDIAPPLDRQVVAMLLNPGRNGAPGTRLDAAALKHRFEISNFDPFRGIMEESDSLMLSRSQVESLQKVDEAYRIVRDSILTDLSRYLAKLDDAFNTRDAARRYDDAMVTLWDLGHATVRRELPRILDRYQLRMLPYQANQFYTAGDDVTGKSIISF
jgi:hypothetical protein